MNKLISKSDGVADMKGATLFDKVEFALRDAGFDFDTAYELATKATDGRGRVLKTRWYLSVLTPHGFYSREHKFWLLAYLDRLVYILLGTPAAYVRIENNDRRDRRK